MPDGGISADAGEEDHGNDRRPGVPSEGRQHLVAVDATHLDVAENEVRGLPVRDAETRRAVGGGVDPVALGLEHLHGQRADLAVVVDHEHPSGAWVRHGSPRGSSSTARTFRKSASAVKGFCRKWVPASSTPWWTMALSVYPDM